MLAQCGQTSICHSAKRLHPFSSLVKLAHGDCRQPSGPGHVDGHNQVNQRLWEGGLPFNERFQEEALAKVSKAARLLLGLLSCWQRAVGSQQEGIGQGQSCKWKVRVGLVGLCIAAGQRRRPQIADRNHCTRPGVAVTLQRCC